MEQPIESLLHENTDQQVCAVVLTYNRKALLKECLEAIGQQSRPANALYIVDNASTDNTSDFLAEWGYIAHNAKEKHTAPHEDESWEYHLSESTTIRMHYLRMHENVGSSGGFHEGIKRAYEKGYDWIWVLDDDGRPDIDCLRRLMDAAKSGFDYVAPNLLDEQGVSHFEEFFSKARTGHINHRGGPFNAILLRRRLIRAVGYPMANFFIWGDEMEYTDRMFEAGFQLITVRDAKHYHKRTMINYRTCLRGFYYTRNSIYRIRLFQGVYRSKVVFAIGRLAMSSIYILRCLLYLRLKEAIRAGLGLIHGYVDPLEEEMDKCRWWGVESR